MTNHPDNAELLAAITTLAAQPKPDSQKAYYAALLKSTLIIAEDPEFSPRPFLLNRPEGKPMLAAFTDLARLDKVLPKTKRIDKWTVPELWKMVRHNNITMININPIQGPGTYLLPHEVESLAAGKLPNIIGDGKPAPQTPEFIGQNDPRLPTAAVMQALAARAAELIRQIPEIEAGYVILIKASDGTPTPAVALHADDSASFETRTTLTDQLMAAGEAVTGGKIRVNWLSDASLTAIQSREKPFYTRQS